MATLVTSWQTTWPGHEVYTNLSITSGSLSVQAGDVIVVWTVTGNAQYLQGASVSDSQTNSYTSRQSYTGNSASNYPFATLHTAVAGSTGTLTVTSTLSQSGGNNIGRCGIYVSVWRDVDTVGASAQAYNSNWTPSVGLTTTQANSVVIGFVNDWNALSGTDTWSTSPGTPTEVVSYGDGSTYGLHVAYYGDAGSAGAKTVSMTAPTSQNSVIFALELTATSAPAVDQSDFQFFDDDGALPGYSYGTTPVIEAADVTGSGNNTASNPSVTYPAYSTGDLLIQVVAVDQNRTITLPSAGPNSETINTICNTTGGGTAGPALACIYWVATAGKSSGNTSWSLDVTDSWDAQTIRVPAGEFDPAKPIDVISSLGLSTNGTDPVATMPAFTADRPNGRIVVVGAVDADPMDATYSPTGWTDLVDRDIGAVCSFSATRDAATSAGESVASADFGINTGDTNSIVGFVVNAPRTTTGATPTAAVNTNASLDVDTTYRWRARIENTGAATTQATYKVQYKHTQGTNTWTDVTSSSSVIRATLTSHFANGDDVGQFIGGSGAYASDNNAALESTGSATLGAVLGANSAFELELAFQVRSADVANDDTIQLRVVESDGTVLDSYTNTPTITVVAAPPVSLTATGIATGAPSTGGAGGTVVHTNISTNNIAQSGVINWTSGSFTPSDNSLLVVTLTTQQNTATIIGSISGGGLTWTKQIETQGTPDFNWYVAVWTAPVSSGSSMSVTITTDTSSNAQLCIAGIEEFTGIDTGSPVGLKGSVNLYNRSGSYNLSLGGTTASDSMVLALGTGDEATTTFAAGWTQVSYTLHQWNDTRVAKKTGAMSSVDFSALNSGWGVCAAGVEVKASPASGPTLEDVAPTSHDLTATGITASPTVGTSTLTALDVLTATGISTGAPLVTHYAIPTATHLVNYQATPGSSPISVTTGSFTPSDNVLLVAVVGFSDINSSNNTANTTLSGGGLTWTKVPGAQYNIWANNTLYVSAEIYTAPVATGASMTVTHTRTGTRGNASCSVEIHISEITNYNAASTTGATMAETSALDGPVSGTLSSLPGTNSLVIGARACDAVNATPLYADPGTGWTELADGNPQNPYWMTVQDQYRVDPQTTSVTWNDIAVNSSVDLVNILFGVEILAARYPVVEDVAGTINLTSVGIAASPVVGTPDVAQIKPAAGQLDAALSWTSTAGASRPRSAQLDATLALTSQAGALRPRSAQLDGSLAIAASAGIVRDASAALTASGTLASSGERVRVGSAALAASVGIASTAVVERSGSSSLGVALAISSSANASRPASASVTAAATATTSASAIKSVSAALSANLSLSAVPAGTAVGSITAAATLSSSAQATRPRSAQLDTNLSVAVSGNAYRPRSAQLDATLSTTVAAQATRPASATLNTAVSVSVSGQASRTASATLSIAGATQGTAGAVRQGSASLTAALTFLALPAGAGAAFMTAGLTVSVSAHADKQRSATLTPVLSALVSAQAIRPVAAALTTSLSLAATATGLGEGTATLSTSASLSASADRYAYRSSAIAATASVASSAERISGATATMATVLSVAASAGAIRPVSAQMDAALVVNGQPTGNFVRSASLAAVATITADGLNKPRFTINLEARLSLRCGWGAAPKKAIVAVKSAGKVRPGVTAGRVNVKIM